MAMNDEETVALIAGGHTFGKMPRRRRSGKLVGPEPEAAPIEEQGLGWKSSYGSGNGDDTITSGLEVTWTPTPTKWDNGYFEILFGYEWELTKSPAGAQQWKAEGRRRRGHGAGCARSVEAAVPTMMTTTDLSLRMDPIYEKISRRFHENPDQFADAFARAWFKLTHRDMGPRARYLGPEVPAEDLIWQDPIPAVDHHADRRRRTSRTSKAKILASGLSVAATGLDRLGVGLDLPRLRQARRRERRAHPPRAAEGLGGQPAGPAGQGARDARRHPEGVQRRAVGGKKVSLADLIVLGGCAAVEKAAKDAGHRREGAVHAGPHGRVAGADRRRILRACSSRSPTASATTDEDEATASRRRSCWSTGRNC